MRNYVLAFGLSSLLLSGYGGRSRASLPAYVIEMKAHTGVSGSDFRVRILRKANYVYLRFGRLDSVQTTRLHNDPQYTAGVAALEAQSVSAATMNGTLQQLATVFQRYEVYRWDSLRVATSTHQPFLQVLDSIYSSSATRLERREANRNRIVLDGTMVHVVVRTGANTEKEFYVHSPSSTSHPQLYNLLHQTLQLYRQESQKPLFDQQYTSGY